MLQSIWRVLKPRKHPCWCPVCDTKPTAFSPLPKSYLKNALRYGFEHLENAETLSLHAYTCPACGASDRERLYALWIDQQIKKGFFPNHARVIHFAPEAALAGKLKERALFD